MHYDIFNMLSSIFDKRRKLLSHDCYSSEFDVTLVGGPTDRNIRLLTAGRDLRLLKTEGFECISAISI